MVSLADPGMKELVLGQQLQGYVGEERYVVKFLTSATGQALNGRTCKVTGHNGQRLLVRMEDDGSTYRLKMCNLLPEKYVQLPVHCTPIPQDFLLRELRVVLDSIINDENSIAERSDVGARVRHVQQAVDQGRLPGPVPCMDPLVPEEQQGNLVAFMVKMAPCCCGDTKIDFQRFAAGLAGGVGAEECAVCLESLQGTGTGGALGFPCGHLFHKRCASQWLQEHSTCPTCRYKLQMPGHEYAYMMGSYRQRLATRLREWFISGMCERCQAAYQETNPMCCVTNHITGEKTMVPRSQLPADWPVEPAPLPF